MKIVSACLAGVNCKRDESSYPCKKIMDLVKQGKAIPVCPEQLGGLATPREATELRECKVFTKSGEDLTTKYEAGVKEALKIALLANCDEAILKSKSPTCGSGKIYDGTFSGKLIDGDGIFTKELKKNGIKVFTENEI